MKDITGNLCAKARIAKLLGSALVESMAVRTEHSRNEAHFGPALPDAVAFVRTTEEVSKVLAICHEESCPVTAWAAGTALEGQHLPVFGGITLNMMEMNRVKAIHAEDMDAVVEPGVTREQLNQDLRATGLFFFSRSRSERVTRRNGGDPRLRHHGAKIRNDARQCSRARSRSADRASDSNRVQGPKIVIGI